MNYNSNGFTLNLYEKNELDKVLASSCGKSPFWRGCATIQDFCNMINLTIDLQGSCGPMKHVYKFNHSSLTMLKEILEEQEQEAKTSFNKMNIVFR